MKNTVRILLFLTLLVGVWYIFKDNIQGGVVGYFSVILTFSLVIIGFVIFLENRHPTQTLTWLIVFGAFPLLGFIFYFLFGKNFRKEKMFRKKYFLDKQAFLSIEGERDVSEEKISGMGEHQKNLFRLAQRLGQSPISFATETKVLTNGDETFSHILEELKKAKHHIHLEYYIVRDDQIGRDIKEVLIERARSGVKVRFLYDAVGAWTLTKQYINDLRNAGVEIVAFGPVRLPFLNNKFNFRNHRKIIVIDCAVGFVGGLNVGDEYLGRNKQYGFWRDTHLMAKGEAVRTLQLIFLQDWYYSTDHSFLTDEYLSPSVPIEHNHGGVQMIAGGPDNEWSVIKSIFFSMITSARESVWIASPYFIPDEDIFQALKVTALSGVDVRLLVPHNPDKRIVFHASRSYFPELLEAGVRIFEYKEGFMHSKIIIVDNELASIGTSNMDMRSFHLNFEVNAFLYKTGSTQKLVNDYLNDLLVSRELHIETFKKRNLGLKVMESTCRLLSPLL
ncbi:cardiolipin synthase [Bacillus sp. M6-12]|uniref:cardiolipin synthase n=1 Tax=Bacillus sp. M6-12 TaxID=2054166 RepID=UPI000C756255|nr:cardiolipin synthase [Bacillus sp. M6-12]PLS15458.1 cardiolipin synthase [Bacillus sp. M6-12]